MPRPLRWETRCFWKRGTRVGGNDVRRRIAALVVEHFKNLRDTRPNDIVSDGIAERTRPIVQDIDAGLQAHKQARGIARGAEPHPFLTEITIDTASLAGKVSFKASSSRWSSARFEFESSADALEIWTSGFFREMPRFANIAVGSSLIVFILSSARLS
jgi:hypothetical protein